MSIRRSAFVIIAATFVLAAHCNAQQPSASPSASPSPASSAEEKKSPAAESPNAKLTSARSVWITRVHGSNIPFETIDSTLAGWMTLSIVDSVDKADVIVTVETYGDNEPQVSTSMAPNASSGRIEQSSKTSKDISASEIKLSVLDAKSKRVLWSSSEKVKFAVKKTSRESNMVEAAQRLASRLHDRMEPPTQGTPRR